MRIPVDADPEAVTLSDKTVTVQRTMDERSFLVSHSCIICRHKCKGTPAILRHLKDTHAPTGHTIVYKRTVDPEKKRTGAINAILDAVARREVKFVKAYEDLLSWKIKLADLNNSAV
jgi:hypothetical protein